jgi:uncharacterized protein YxjI
MNARHERNRAVSGRAGRRERRSSATDKVAEVSKRWLRVRDTYGVEVFPGQDDMLILAAAAVIDTMAYPDR